MQYGEVVSRSFALWWRHKYLWILGILGGGGTGFNFNSGGRFGGGPSGGPGGNPNEPIGGLQGAPTAAAFGDWILAHLGLIIAVGLVFLLIGIVLFVIGCIAQPALVEAAAWHDGDQPYGFRQAWSTGRRFLWRVLGFRLLVLLAVGLPVTIVVGLFVAAIALLASQVAIGVPLLLIAIVLALALVAYVISVSIVAELALRAIVLQRRRVMEGIGAAIDLFRRRLGRTLLVWLIAAGLGIGIGLIVGIVVLLLLAPLAAIVIAAYVAGSFGGAIVAAIPAALIFLLAAAIIGGIAQTFSSIYWTLAYRRLDLQPVVAAPPQPPAYPPPTG